MTLCFQGWSFSIEHSRAGGLPRLQKRSIASPFTLLSDIIIVIKIVKMAGQRRRRVAHSSWSIFQCSLLSDLQKTDLATEGQMRLALILRLLMLLNMLIGEGSKQGTSPEEDSFWTLCDCPRTAMPVLCQNAEIPYRMCCNDLAGKQDFWRPGT